MPTVRITFSFDALEDADVLRWLGQKENASAAVREAIRHEMGLVQRLATLEDTLGRVLGALERVSGQLGVVGPGGALKPQETLSSDAVESDGLEEMLGKFRGGA